MAGRAQQRANLAWAQPLGHPPTAETRAELAEFLRRFADHVERDEVVCEPYGAVLVFLGQRDSAVVWHEIQTTAQLRLARETIFQRLVSGRRTRSANVVERDNALRMIAARERTRIRAIGASGVFGARAVWRSTCSGADGAAPPRGAPMTDSGSEGGEDGRGRNRRDA